MTPAAAGGRLVKGVRASSAPCWRRRRGASLTSILHRDASFAPGCPESELPFDFRGFRGVLGQSPVRAPGGLVRGASLCGSWLLVAGWRRGQPGAWLSVGTATPGNPTRLWERRRSQPPRQHGWLESIPPSELSRSDAGQRRLPSPDGGANGQEGQGMVAGDRLTAGRGG